MNTDREEYREKIAIKNRLVRYYRAQSRKYGLSDMAKIKAYMPEALQPREFRRDLVIAHLDLEPILAQISEGKEFVMVSGLNPSSPLHVGHATLFRLLSSLQKLGGRIYIPLTNDESYIDGKASSMGESRRMAYEEILPSIVGFGFDPQRTHMYLDTEYPTLYAFAMRVSRYVSMREVRSMFGKDSLVNPGQVFYRGCVQLAEILMPQLPEFGGPKPTLIPVGIDQHPYILLARDVAKRMGLIPPSELVLRFAPSLKNPEKKMSGSKPETAIYLTDDPATIQKKIGSAFTGSVSTLAGHEAYGGVPEACSVFALLTAYLPDDEVLSDLRVRYRAGTIRMGVLKDLAIATITTFVEHHREERQRLEHLKSSYIFNQPIRSYSE